MSSSKWILLLLTIALIQSVLCETKLRNEDEEEEFHETDEHTTTDESKSDKLISDYYYRLINLRFGRDFAMDISKVASQFVVKMVPVNKKRLGQIWRFIPLEQNVYQVQNYHLKDEYAVELVGSAKVNQLVMSKTSDSSYQKWSITFDNTKDNRMRIFNLFLGENYFLNINSQTRYAYMNRTHVDDFGQYWTLEAVDRIDEQ